MTKNIPQGFIELKDVTAVFISDNDEIVVLGIPEEDGGHHCDYMGCSSVEHVIYRCKVTDAKIGW